MEQGAFFDWNRVAINNAYRRKMHVANVVPSAYDAVVMVENAFSLLSGMLTEQNCCYSSSIRYGNVGRDAYEWSFPCPSLQRITGLRFFVELPQRGSAYFLVDDIAGVITNQATPRVPHVFPDSFLFNPAVNGWVQGGTWITLSMDGGQELSGIFRIAEVAASAYAFPGAPNPIPLSYARLDVEYDIHRALCYCGDYGSPLLNGGVTRIAGILQGGNQPIGGALAAVGVSMTKAGTIEPQADGHADVQDSLLLKRSARPISNLYDRVIINPRTLFGQMGADEIRALMLETHGIHKFPTCTADAWMDGAAPPVLHRNIFFSSPAAMGVVFRFIIEHPGIWSHALYAGSLREADVRYPAEVQALEARCHAASVPTTITDIFINQQRRG